MSYLQQLLPILILLAVIAIVLVRLPKVELGHSALFKRRRILNWLPLGLTYAFLYMGRYNLTVSKNAFGDLMTKADFGTIFFWGTIVYGFSFLINGPLTDKFGGRRTILIAAVGSAIANIAMGLVTYFQLTSNLVLTFSVLYAINMYFQSFGAVAIVKVNAHWFHVKERGTFGGIFGILISLGIYFAFDWGAMIAKELPIEWVFFIPAIILSIFWMIDLFVIRDYPSQAGFQDFDTADASSGAGSEHASVMQVVKGMLTNPIIVTIALIEFCSGFLRNAIMQWYIIFANQTGIANTFVPKNWGLMLCCAGIVGGMTAGIVSDRIFHSRRGPVAAVLYGLMLAGSVVMCFMLQSPMLGILVVFLSMCITSVHGMLSGTASMDFGGKKNAGLAVGIIDGMVYAGTALQAIIYGWVLPEGAAQKDPANWNLWPVAMIPLALIGFALATRIWGATAQNVRDHEKGRQAKRDAKAASAKTLAGSGPTAAQT